MADLSPRPPSTGRLTRDTLLFGAAGALGKSLALVTVPILSRSLGPEDYGIADLAVGLSGLATLVVTFSGDMSAARLRALATTERGRATVLTSWLAATALLAIAVALVLLPLADTVATVLWSAPGQGSLAALAILLIPLAASQAAFANALRIVGRPIAAASAAMIDLVAQVGLAVMLVLLGAGPTGILLGYLGGSAVGLAVAGLLALKYLSAPPRWATGVRVVGLGLAFLPVGTVFVVTEYAVRFVLATIESREAVGQFAVALRLASVMLLVSAAFSLAWGPYGLSLRPTIGTFRMFERLLQALGSMLLVAAILIAAAAPELVIIVSGHAYLPASRVLPGLVWGAASSGIFFVMIVGAGVAGRRRPILLAAVTGGVVQMGATLLMLGPFGLDGVGAAALLGRLVSLAMVAVAIRDLVPLRGRYVAATLLSACLVLGLSAANSVPLDTWPARGLVGLAAVAGAYASARHWLRPGRNLPSTSA